MGIYRQENKGFTLIELLVTMAVVSIIMVAVISAFNIQQKSQVKQQLIAEVQQNVRAATYMLARDIRMASFGLGDGEVTYWDGASYQPYKAINIVNSNPDRIEILYAVKKDIMDTGMNGTEVDALTTSLLTNSEDILNVDDATDIDAGDTMIIANGSHSSLIDITSIADAPKLDHAPEVGVNPPIGQQITSKGSYDIGSRLYKLRYMTYDVSYDNPSHPVMRMDDTGPRNGDQFVKIAEDIEDLQAFYVFENGDELDYYNDAETDHTYADIRAVKINITARTRTPRSDFGGDGYGRRNLELELKIRNFGLN